MRSLVVSVVELEMRHRPEFSNAGSPPTASPTESIAPEKLGPRTTRLGFAPGFGHLTSGYASSDILGECSEGGGRLLFDCGQEASILDSSLSRGPGRAICSRIFSTAQRSW